MNKILTVKFFDRPTLKVARELLGKFLVRKIGKQKIFGIITEVEAYVGLEDKASHASRGKTERTKVMFGKANHWYVYLIYGMHYCLNIVTEKEGYPAAILIRSMFPFCHTYQRPLVSVTKVIKGPGRVCRYFKIDKKLNTKPSERNTGLWIEDRKIKISPRMIKRGKRIGVDYAGKWKDKHWRFYIEHV